jgi:hypothetical protein
MRRHVQACPACHADMDARRRLRASIRTAFDQAHELKARPEFTRKLRETLRSAALARHDLARDLRRHGGHWPRPLLGVGLAGALWARDRRASRALLRAAVGDHRYCALDFRLAEYPIPLSEAATRFDSSCGDSTAEGEYQKPRSSPCSAGWPSAVQSRDERRWTQGSAPRARRDAGDNS